MKRPPVNHYRLPAAKGWLAARRNKMSTDIEVDSEFGALRIGRGPERARILTITNEVLAAVPVYVPPRTTTEGWPEDAPYENGKYLCTCLACRGTFMGHKRRVICKTCAGMPNG